MQTPPALPKLTWSRRPIAKAQDWGVGGQARDSPAFLKSSIPNYLSTGSTCK